MSSESIVTNYSSLPIQTQNDELNDAFRSRLSLRPVQTQNNELNDAFRSRLSKILQEDVACTDRQLTWLRLQFAAFESQDATQAPFSEYLTAASRFPTIFLPSNHPVGDFRFHYRANWVFVTVPLHVLNDLDIQVEQFVSLLRAFIKTSEESFFRSKYDAWYKIKDLHMHYVPKTKDNLLFMQFAVNFISVHDAIRGSIRFDVEIPKKESQNGQGAPKSPMNQKSGDYAYISEWDAHLHKAKIDRKIQQLQENRLPGWNVKMYVPHDSKNVESD